MSGSGSVPDIGSEVVSKPPLRLDPGVGARDSILKRLDCNPLFEFLLPP